MRRLTVTSVASIMAAALLFGAVGPSSAALSAVVSRPAQETSDAPAAARTGDFPGFSGNSDRVGNADKVVRMARAGWDTGWFQAEIYKQLLQRLGYRVIGPVTMDNDEFYSSLAVGGVDLWANGWFPLHDPFLVGNESVEAVGTQVSGGALQGYFVDKATADAYGITNLGDLADSDVAALFDYDGDGLADLIGCDEGWTCALTIDTHLEAFGLTGHVEQIQGQYSPLIQEALARQRAGEPALYYTWTPNWTVGLLKLGEDTVWLQTPEASTAAPQVLQRPESARVLTDTTVRVDGCAAEQCRTGWEPSDIRAVANSDFLDANPAVRTLLEQVVIPLQDISEQNARMVEGEGDPEDIVAHAQAWIADNRSLVEGWINAADPDAVAYSPAGAPDADADREPLRVTARVLPPFVTYGEGRFGGFEVELVTLLANRLGMRSEFSVVDTIAKQIDDLDRSVADVALGGVAITKSRETQVDFSLPVLDTGLRVMIPVEERSGIRNVIGGYLRALADSGLFLLLIGVVIAVLLAAHLIWLMERRNNPDFAQPYPKGIWDSFYWSVVTMSTVGYGDKVPRGRIGRAFSLLWIIFGTLVFAVLTAAIASSLAVDRLRQDISGPSDLHGHRVATVADSPGDTYLTSVGIGPVRVAEIDDAIARLRDGDVDAVVFDAPVLEYWASNNGAGEVTVVGPDFETVRYGIAMPAESHELREQINRALLDMEEADEFDRVRDRYFGAR